MTAHAEVFERVDGRWAFRVVVGNNETVATDGGQGYENRSDAERTARRLANGWEADMQKSKRTLFGVARGESILDDELFPSYAAADAKIIRVEQAMRTAGLEPDVRLVQVESTTSYSRPVKAEQPEHDEPPVTVPTTGEGIYPNPQSGIWGDTGVPISEDPGYDPTTETVEGVPANEGEGGTTDQGAPTTDNTGGHATPDGAPTTTTPDTANTEPS